MTRIAVMAAAAVALSFPALAQGRPAVPSDAEITRQAGDFFSQIDRNHDGVISRVEMTSYGYSHRWGVAVREKRWKRADANHDGKITRDEFVSDAHNFFDRRRG
jgi:hypothetical protein